MGHTPGPWQRDPQADLTITRLFAGGDRAIIAAVFPGDLAIDLDTCRDNARLIAAAPDLLAALKRALDAGIGGDGERPSPSEQARAAIAKARGTT